jgi:hypothetical protein
MPEKRAASSFLPTAKRCRPKTVRCRTNHASTAITAKAIAECGTPAVRPETSHSSVGKLARR